jgi:flavin-dependent dehydrogenase
VLATGAPAVRQVVFHVGGERLERPVKARSGVEIAIAPRRQVLDALLLDAAVRAGAQVLTGVAARHVLRDHRGRVRGLLAEDARGRPVELRSNVVVGADGVRSRVARSVRAPFVEVRPARGATHYAYFRGSWPAMEYYVGERAFCGIFPTNDDEACIWSCNPAAVAEAVRRASPSPAEALLALVDRCDPGLAERVSAAERTSPVRGTLRLPNHVRQAAGDGWALVGDAGYHRDAITGHGISDAFRDAELLADALDRSLRDREGPALALRGYQARRDEMLREIFEITVALADFPSVPRMLELQRDLGAAIDAQASVLAAWPAPTSRRVAS